MIGERVGKRRQDLKLTQGELGQLADIDRQTIYRIEHNRQDATSKLIVRLATALAVSADYLLGLVDEPAERVKMSDLPSDLSQIEILYRQNPEFVRGVLHTLTAAAAQERERRGADGLETKPRNGTKVFG